MGAIINTILGVLGLGNGASVVNKAVGIVNNMALVPIVMYLLAHADEQVHFSASLGFLALLGMMLYIIMEIARRSNPHEGG